MVMEERIGAVAGDRPSKCSLGRDAVTTPFGHHAQRMVHRRPFRLGLRYLAQYRFSRGNVTSLKQCPAEMQLGKLVFPGQFAGATVCFQRLTQPAGRSQRQAQLLVGEVEAGVLARSPAAKRRRPAWACFPATTRSPSLPADCWAVVEYRAPLREIL